MSEFAVKVVRIDRVVPHPDADALELAMIEGSMWQTVVAKGQYGAGDTALFVPVEAQLPIEVSDAWGVTKYLSKQRVRAARLRGQMSYGFLAKTPDGAKIGDDFTEAFGITKYEPPVSLHSGDMDRALPTSVFPMYTDIESVQNYPNVLVPGESVIATEKRHGTNSRVGFCRTEDGPALVCGSHTNRRKLGAGSIYELPLLLPQVAAMIESCGPDAVLFGELFGSKIQGAAFPYGSPNKPVFEAFDLWVNGTYLDDDDFRSECKRWGVPTVPTLYRGSWNPDTIRPLTNGVSVSDPGTVREGIVIRPERERIDPNIGRVILKWKGDDFLLNKHSS